VAPRHARWQQPMAALPAAVTGARFRWSEEGARGVTCEGEVTGVVARAKESQSSEGRQWQ
jgi:hypothetical protein